ncbi:MAG: hypothetical protein M3Z75_23210 [Actinomycetota bacterium]|nr:hypothetical protein [Actinomycetota bacterium]
MSSAWVPRSVTRQIRGQRPAIIRVQVRGGLVQDEQRLCVPRILSAALTSRMALPAVRPR